MQFMPAEQMPGYAIKFVNVLIRTVLLYDKDGLACFEYFQQLVLR
jgi:hypothetical protein